MSSEDSGKLSDSIFSLMLNSIPIFDGGSNGISYANFKTAVNNLKTMCTNQQILIFNTNFLKT